MKKILFALSVLFWSICAFVNVSYAQSTYYPVAEQIDEWEFNDITDFPSSGFISLPVYEEVDGVGTAKFAPVTAGKNVGFYQSKINDYLSNEYLVLETKYKITKELTKQMYLFGTQCMGIETTSLYANGYKLTDLAMNEWHTVVYVVDLSSATVDAGVVNGIQPYRLIVDDVEYDLSENSVFSQNVQWNFIEPNSNTNGVIYMDYYRVYIPGEPEMRSQNIEDYNIIKERIISENKPVYSADNSVEAYVSLTSDDGTFSDLDYTDSSDRMEHLTRLEAFSQAYAYNGSKYYLDETILKKMFASMEYFVLQRYTSIGTAGGWDLWITAPQKLAKSMFNLTVAGAEIPEITLTRAKNYWFILCDANGREFCYDFVNCSSTAMLWEYMSVIYDDNTYIDKIYNNVLDKCTNHTNGTDEFGINDGGMDFSEVRGKSYFGSGIYPDWSFLAHGPMHYTLGYGRQILIGGAVKFIEYAAGTEVQFNQAQLKYLVGFFLENYRWMLRGANSEFIGLQRGISRIGTTGTVTSKAGKDCIAWCQGLLEEEDIPRKEEISVFLESLNENKEQSYVIGNRHYWLSDLMAHHRDNYFAMVKTVSNRTLKGEALGTEGTNNYYLSDGEMPIFVTGKEYQNAIVVWDWDRLPGITAIQTDEDVPQMQSFYGACSFVGGASDGNYGVSTMDYDDPTGVNAKKSWFFFDDEVVALGTDITIDDGIEGQVATSVNQSSLDGDVTYWNSDGENALAQQAEYTDCNISKVYHANIGYVLPDGQNITVSNKAQTGNGGRKDTAIEMTEFTRDIFSLTLNEQTQTGEYSYIAVPGISKGDFVEYADNIPIEIVENTVNAQAVYHKNLKLLEAVIREAGATVTTEEGLSISADQPCIIMLQETDGQYKLTVQNPENQQFTVNIQINRMFATEEYDSGNILFVDGKSIVSVTNRTGLYTGESVIKTYSKPTETISILFTDNEGKKITDVEQGTVNISIYAPSTKNSVAIVGTYSGLRFESAKISEIKSSVTNIPATIPEGGYIKVMVWDSLRGLRPLRAAIQLPEI